MAHPLSLQFVGRRRTRDDGDLATFGQSQPGLGLCFSRRRRLGWRNSLGRLRHDAAEAETIDLVMGGRWRHRIRRRRGRPEGRKAEAAEALTNAMGFGSTNDHLRLPPNGVPSMGRQAPGLSRPPPGSGLAATSCAKGEGFVRGETGVQCPINHTRRGRRRRRGCCSRQGLAPIAATTSNSGPNDFPNVLRRRRLLQRKRQRSRRGGRSSMPHHIQASRRRKVGELSVEGGRRRGGGSHDERRNGEGN